MFKNLSLISLLQKIILASFREVFVTCNLNNSDDFPEMENWLKSAMIRGPWSRTHYADHYRMEGGMYLGCNCIQKCCPGRVALKDKKLLKGKIIHSPLTFGDLKEAKAYHKPLSSQEDQVRIAEEVGAPKPKEEYFAGSLHQEPLPSKFYKALALTLTAVVFLGLGILISSYSRMS